MKQMRQIMMTVALMLTTGAMAQSVDETQPKDGMPEMAMRPQRMKRITQEQMTRRMVRELMLDKQQLKYDKKLRKLLSDDQYEGYLRLKPQFYSQRRIREFLLGGEMNMPNVQ